jgi:DNA polymerase-1
VASVLDSLQLHYVETSAEAAEFIEWLKTPRHSVAVDTETTGLARDARIRLIQFGAGDAAWTLRWDQWKGAAVEGLELLKRARQRVSFHNTPYDVPKIEAQSMEVGRWPGFKFDWGLVDDTMLMSRLAHPMGSHSLKSLAAKHVDPRSRSMQNVLADAMAQNNWTWESVPYDYVGYTVYAGVDTALTALLLAELEKMEFSRDMYATEMTVAEACCAMEDVGLAVDLDYCQTQIHLLAGEIDGLVAQARTAHGVSALGSNQIVIDKLHDLGLHWEERTDKGRVALDKDVLGRLMLEPGEGGRLARTVLEYRQRLRLLQAYFRHFVEGEDGRIHPDINSLEAVTGRMSVSQPAMQQLPRGPRVRRAVVADPGHRLMLMDYSQIEIRVLAHYCKDPLLREAIETGDVHTASAQLIFGRE